MRLIAFLMILSLGGTWARTGEAREAQSARPTENSPAGSDASPQPETEQIQSPQPQQAASKAGANEMGYLEPAQVNALIHKVWLAEFRIDDLLTQVRPERWKAPDAARESFIENLAALRSQLEALEAWRGQFEKRVDSIYLGFEVYRAANGVLPRLDSVAHAVSQNENRSLGAQYTQAGNQLSDLHQTLGAYLGFLLGNQDQVLQALESNLASCQNTLGYAMRRSMGAARPMANSAPARPDLRRSHRRSRSPGRAESPAKSEKKTKLSPRKKPNAAVNAAREKL